MAASKQKVKQTKKSDFINAATSFLAVPKEKCKIMKRTDAENNIIVKSHPVLTISRFPPPPLFFLKQITCHSKSDWDERIALVLHYSADRAKKK